MLKEITLNAEESIVQKAQIIAQTQQTTLEAEFQKWLEYYTSENSDGYAKLMHELSHVKVGRTFTRDELNER